MQTTTARPRFRQDLIAELVEDGGQRFIDVADPDSGHMFRFFEVEYSLACAMDGERDVAGIVKWAQEELGITPTTSEVQAVISQLSSLQFVGADRSVDAAATKVAAAQPRAEELAKGVVVGKQASATATADVELGKAGTATAAPRDEKLPAADFALGASGASASTKATARTPVEDIALGAPGAQEARRPASASAPPASDVSLDLADQFALKPGDVKEAVRQSKVMAAVEVPKDLLDAEAKPAKPVERKPDPVVAKQPEKQPEVAKAKEPEKKPQPVEKKPDPVVAKQPEKAPEKKTEPPKDEKKPVALSKPPVVEKQPVAPPAPSSGVSPILISILILVVIGAGAFFVWKFVINKEETAQSTPPAKMDPVPPPPADVTSKVVMETPPALEIKAGSAGAIESIEAIGKDVKAGDVIATLAGAKALQTELDRLTADIEKLQPAVTAAEEAHQAETQKENNEAGVKAAQAKLDRAKKPLTDKQTTQKTKQADLEKLIIKAPGDGTLAAANAEGAPLAVGDKVTADQVIAKVARPTAPVATFKIPSGTKIAADGTLSIIAGDQTVVCTVSDAQVETVKVTCPADAGLADGADVKFTLPK